MRLEKAIFEIDDDKNLHTVAKFLRHVDTLRAMGKINPVHQTIGSFEGKLSMSYMMDAKDLPLVYDYIKEQDWILRVPGDTRQPASLETPKGRHVTTLGPLRKVSDPGKEPDWTYEPTTETYWIA
jgi:hypothetical protein